MFISQQQGLAVAASSMAILAAWLLVRGTLAEPCKKSAVALAVVNVAGVLTMYGFVFAVLAQGLLLVFLRRQDHFKRNDIRFALLAPFAALLLASPLVYAQFKILKQQMAAFPMLMRLWEAPLGVWVADLGFGAPWGIVFAEGSAAPQWIGITLSVLGFLLLVAGTFQAVREREAAGMGILGAAYGTLFVIGIASLAVPLWNDRTFAFIVPFFALILALAVTRFRKTLYPVAAIVVTFAAIGWAQDQIRASGENAAWHKPPAWDAVARELDASLRGGDTVLAVPGWHSEVLRYHLRHGTKEKEGSLIPIVGVPYDHFRAATEETADIGSPQGSAVWLVAAEGFFTQGVTKALAKEGFVLERHTSFWRVSLDLYVTKDMAKPKPAAATPDDAAETAETTDSLE
ncbi:MAG: hypothetical protein M5R36_00710 [Deltaproteobacteria bacterium]|nr:hypothetical protein [Deltaproteobacteria bacterium]